MADIANSNTTGSPPRTYFEKIWDEHFIKAFDSSEHLLQIDRLMLHEAMGTVAMRELLQEVVAARVKSGDGHIRYLSGLELFGPADRVDVYVKA